MPYVICGACTLVTYSAALWASTDECPRCGASLPNDRRTDLLWSAMKDQIADQLRSGDSHSGGPGHGEPR